MQLKKKGRKTMAREINYEVKAAKLELEIEKLKLKLEKEKTKTAEMTEKYKTMKEKYKKTKEALDPEAAEKLKKKLAKKAMKEIHDVKMDNAETLEFESISQTIDTKIKEQILNIKTAEVTKDTFRFVVDRFYDAQDKRIKLSNQIDSIQRGTDHTDEDSLAILQMEYAIYLKLENNYAKLMDKLTVRTRSGRWLREVCSVGPALAATFEAYLDVEKGSHASSFQSYCGLNDHSKPWYSKEQAKKFVDDALTKYDTSEVTDDVIIEIASKTGWKVEFLEEHCAKYDEHNPDIIVGYDKSALTKAITILPYNKALKVACWKLSDGFVKNSNRKSKYGKIYKQRKAYELDKNEKGEYAEISAKYLEKTNYTGETRAIYESGKLPLGHIENRCRRYAVKMFISHYFEACYYYKYGERHVPYPIQFLGHSDYVEPEVPYDSIK